MTEMRDRDEREERQRGETERRDREREKRQRGETEREMTERRDRERQTERDITWMRHLVTESGIGSSDDAASRS